MKKVIVEGGRIVRFARRLRDLAEVVPNDFCSLREGVLYPRRGGPGVVDYFFFCCAHQFGFWHLEEDRYSRPMIARVGGVEWKGSDYVFRCATRAWARRPDFFSPRALAAVTDREWAEVFADDDGLNPLPMWEEHLEIIRGSLAWFRERGGKPEDIVERANRAPRVLSAFLSGAGDIPGYSEDPLRKKLYLLALTLQNRPEGFLRVNDPEVMGPIIDYHLQRSVLRAGLVEVRDPGLRGRLASRRLVAEEEEAAVRRAAFRAVEKLMALSGLSPAAIDYFFFTNRRRCPEMEEPRCSSCPVNSVCARRTELFQPVFRTPDY